MQALPELYYNIIILARGRANHPKGGGRKNGTGEKDELLAAQQPPHGARKDAWSTP